MLHIKIIQALDPNGNVVLAKNVNIIVDTGDALEIVYKIVKQGQQQRITMDNPTSPECEKAIKEFDSWLTELPESPSTSTDIADTPNVSNGDKP